jgi:hypothetical protein
MTTEAWAYGTVAEVQALTRHLLTGGVFDEISRPTIGEVEIFINYASAQLNGALAGAGFTVPVTQSTVLYELDAWVVAKAAMYVELTQPGAGYSDDQTSRTAVFERLAQMASEYVAMNANGWQELGAAFSSTTGAGLSFTAMNKRSERTDPTVTTREQPLFRRRQFDR